MDFWPPNRGDWPRGDEDPASASDRRSCPREVAPSQGFLGSAAEGLWLRRSGFRCCRGRSLTPSQWISGEFRQAVIFRHGRGGCRDDLQRAVWAAVLAPESDLRSGSRHTTPLQGPHGRGPRLDPSWAGLGSRTGCIARDSQALAGPGASHRVRTRADGTSERGLRWGERCERADRLDAGCFRLAAGGLGEVHAAEEVLEAGVGAEGIERWPHLEKGL